MHPGAGGKVDFPLLYEKFDPLAAGQSTDSSRVVYLVLLIAYASSIWNSIANGYFIDPMV